MSRVTDRLKNTSVMLAVWVKPLVLPSNLIVSTVRSGDFGRRHSTDI